MGISINNTGKLFLGSLAAYAAAKTWEAYQGGEEPADPHLGLPPDLYNTLSEAAFRDDRDGFLRTLTAAGAPGDMNFRRRLWAALGGR